MDNVEYIFQFFKLLEVLFLTAKVLIACSKYFVYKINEGNFENGL
jgi:hypothetical protein